MNNIVNMDINIDDIIFEYEMFADDECNKNRGKYRQISEWLKELKTLKGMYGGNNEEKLG